MRWERAEVKVRARETPEGKKASGRKGGVWGPGKRWGHTCNAAKGGRALYVFGGYGKDNCQTNDVHVFDTAKQTWSKPMMKGVPPSPRDSHTCTTVGNDLYVFGGTDGSNPLNDLHILDTSSNTWISPNIRGKGPDAREGHSAALVGKKLFIFGGCGKSRDNPEEIYYNDLYVLDTEEQTWERAVTSGSPPSARDSHTCSSWKNKLVVLGGEDASDYYLSDVYILDTDTLVWTQLNTSGQMLAPRAGHCTVALGRNLFVFGGFTDDRNLYDDLHILNVETGIWSRVANVSTGPSARFSAAGDCLDAQRGILVFIGGCNATLEALDDMYYLFTDMPGENGKAQRPEKLSLKRELKQKCQEDLYLGRDPVLNMESSPAGLLPWHSVDGFPSSACSSQSDRKRPFQATITGTFPGWYTLETIIDGKKLRGLVFTQAQKSQPDSHMPAKMEIALDDGDAHMDGTHQFEVAVNNAGDKTTGSSRHEVANAIHKDSAPPGTSKDPIQSGLTTLSCGSELKGITQAMPASVEIRDQGHREDGVGIAGWGMGTHQALPASVEIKGQSPRQDGGADAHNSLPINL